MISQNRVIRENVPQKITEFSAGRHIATPSGSLPWLFQRFFLSAELSHIDIDASI